MIVHYLNAAGEIHPFPPQDQRLFKDHVWEDKTPGTEVVWEGIWDGVPSELIAGTYLTQIENAVIIKLDKGNEILTPELIEELGGKNTGFFYDFTYFALRYDKFMRTYVAYDKLHNYSLNTSVHTVNGLKRLIKKQAN